MWAMSYALNGKSAKSLPNAPPGPYHFDRVGTDGWYAIFLLVELLGDRRVWTPKRVKQFQRGEFDQYRFEAELFAEWADRLLPLFEPNHDQSWRDEF